jgi:hypothetical protein
MYLENHLPFHWPLENISFIRELLGMKELNEEKGMKTLKKCIVHFIKKTFNLKLFKI